MNQENLNQKNIFYLPNVEKETVHTEFSHTYSDYIHSLNSSPFLHIKELWFRVYERPNEAESSWVSSPT